MTDERDKLLQIMNSLEADYKSGKISSEKYRYFRSKYEDKLNSIDALEATKRIRSMQGKPEAPKTNKKRSKPARNRKQEQDLVQKYIINPKKEDARYHQQKKSSMSGGTFRLIAILVLVIAFTAGVAYGIFNLDTEAIADTSVVAIVEDTAFPEIVAVVNDTNDNITIDENETEEVVETTTETTTDTSTDTDDSSSYSGSNTPTPAPEPEPEPTPTPTPTPDDGGGSSDGGGSEG